MARINDTVRGGQFAQKVEQAATRSIDLNLLKAEFARYDATTRGAALKRLSESANPTVRAFGQALQNASDT